MSSILQAFNDNFQYGEVHAMEDNSVFFRHDTDDSDPQEQWDNYCEVVEDLKKIGLELEDPCVEHDCINGTLKWLTP